MYKRIWLALLCAGLQAQTADEIGGWLAKPILDPKEALLDVQVYTASRVPVVPTMKNAAEWETYAAGIRKRMFDEVVFRGEARNWRSAQRKFEALDTIDADGYRIRKFRFEVVPGLWVPALVYEPKGMTGKVPVVLNVMGHEKEGVSTPYIQQRCINLAKRGMIAVNVEWLGRGQLSWDDYNHYKIAQVDLTGTSGIALFYLHLERTLDLILRHENADPNRVAVTGLSGGGWQTTMISALDTRVKLAVPAAGHSSFVTRAQMPMMDLGDSEQTPSDMASVADYLHMSALVAPRPLMLVHNANDTCCFRADYALGPLAQTTRQVYGLFGALDHLRYFVNHEPGHNYGQTTREELYRFLKDEFKGSWDTKEIPVESEVRTAEKLASPLPADNATFQSLALKLAQGLPRGNGGRAELAAVVKAQTLAVDAREVSREKAGAAEVIRWRLRLGRAWSVPAVEIVPQGSKDTVIVVSDDGKKSQTARVTALVASGKRVIAVDPFYLGEAKITTRDHLFAILIASLGERPLGLQASQLTAVAHWAKRQAGGKVELEAFGRRASLMSVVAAGLEPDTISASRLHGSLRSLQQILSENLTAEKHPEFFCFGLLEQFDIPQMAKLGTNVKFEN